jgi:Four helix bundle sensory module for signal transduction
MTVDKHFRQLGIKSRLFFAFGAVAGTTVIASIAGWLLLAQIGGLVKSVAQENIPAVIATLELASKTESLSAQAPALLNAETQEKRAQQVAALKELQNGVAQRLDLIAHLPSQQGSVETLRRSASTLNERIAKLDEMAEKRLALSAQRSAAVTASTTAHGKLLAVLDPLQEKAQDDITMASMTIGGDATQSTMTLLKLVSRKVPLAQTLSDLEGAANLAAGMLERAGVAPTVDAVEALRKDYAEQADRVDEKIDIADALQKAPELRKAVEAFLAGAAAPFDLRKQEIEARQVGAKILEETRGVITELNAEVARQVEAVRGEAKSATDRSDGAVGFGTLIMLAIAAASLVGAFLIV